MSKLLLVYSTTEGQTKKIIDAIGAELIHEGCSVDFLDAEEIKSSLNYIDSEHYDGVIVGASVHAGRYRPAIVEWCKQNAQTLSKVPSAFFSVCLGVLQDDQNVQKEERQIVFDFLIKTGWTPVTHAIFPGAILYSKYNWLKKFLMKTIAEKAGVKTSFRQDYEFTDWNNVKTFARNFVQYHAHSTRQS